MCLHIRVCVCVYNNNEEDHEFERKWVNMEGVRGGKSGNVINITIMNEILKILSLRNEQILTTSCLKKGHAKYATVGLLCPPGVVKTSSHSVAVFCALLDQASVTTPYHLQSYHHCLLPPAPCLRFYPPTREQATVSQEFCTRTPSVGQLASIP